MKMDVMQKTGNRSRRIAVLASGIALTLCLGAVVAVRFQTYDPAVPAGSETILDYCLLAGVWLVPFASVCFAKRLFEGRRVYSHIVEEKFGKSVSKMHLYYTRVEGESPYVTWDFDPKKVEGTLKKFGETVAKIEGHRFSNKGIVKCARLCDGCDMRFYCNYK